MMKAIPDRESEKRTIIAKDKWVLSPKIGTFMP